MSCASNLGIIHFGGYGDGTGKSPEIETQKAIEMSLLLEYHLDSDTFDLVSFLFDKLHRLSNGSAEPGDLATSGQIDGLVSKVDHHTSED